MSETHARPAESLGAGIAWIVAAFFFVAVMSALGKAAGGVPTPTLVFFQNLVPLLLFAPWALRGGLCAARTSRLPLHLFRAVTGLLSQALMFEAVRRIPLVDAVLLSNSTPLFIPFIAWIWLRKRIGAAVAAGLGIGFAGVLLILRPAEGALASPGAVIALGSALLSALALVAVDLLSATEPASRILFYYFAISSAATLPFAAFGGRAPERAEWPGLLGIGVCMALAQLLIILAYRNAAASRIAPFNYTVVIFSGLLGWLVWGHRPGWLDLAGVALVAGGGVATVWRGGRHVRAHLGWLGHGNLHRSEATS